MADTQSRGRARRGPRRCSKCGAPVAKWRNANREDRWLYVDLSLDEKGTVEKIVSGTPDAPIVYGRVLNKHDLAESDSRDQLLFTLHSTTCTANRPTNPKPDGLALFPPPQHPMR